MDYTYFYKRCYSSLDELSSIEEYDYYISSYVETDRVLIPKDIIKSKEFIWVVKSEDESNIQLTNCKKFIINSIENYDVMVSLANSIDLNNKRLCLDSTGFYIPDLLFLIRYLNAKGLTKLDVLYTEPSKYKQAEETNFSEYLYEVKQIYGMSGVHTSQMNDDMLVIAAGYDHSRIVDVANKKKSARKVLLYGFPSMSPSMFQENVSRVHKAEPALGTECFKDMDMNIYAPAYDPFVTAQTIKEYVERNSFTNLYLAPLSSKPQALGMALYFLWEAGNTKNMSIVYPICEKYYLDTSEGIARIWRYTFELPNNGLC